jgi:hypothetical protein
VTYLKSRFSQYDELVSAISGSALEEMNETLVHK